MGYIEEKLANVLKREKQEQLEKRFQERLLKFKCSKCGRDSGLHIVTGIIVCDCGCLYLCVKSVETSLALMKQNITLSVELVTQYLDYLPQSPVISHPLENCA